MANNWYYAAGGKQAGPVTEEQLDSLVSSGVVRADTLVWHEGLTEWQSYGAARPEAPLPPIEPAATPAATRFCTECGQPRLERELVTFGNRLVCYACKDAFAQRLREQGGLSKGFQYAGFWIRFLARLLDGLILYIVILPVTLLLLGRSAFTRTEDLPSAADAALHVVLIVFQISLSAAYEVWFLTRYGATPGKMVIGKKVVTADGAPLSIGRALGRYFATWLSYFTLMIGFIMAAFDEEKRALHDRICDTRVVTK